MKYMGSKARIAKNIAPILNDAIVKSGFQRYVEPFVGGANMIEHIVCEERYGLDSNKYLIAMWNALLSGWNPPDQITREQYEEIRDNKDKFPDELVAFAGFVATFKAKWFGGYAGITATKIGTTRNYYDEAKRNVLAQLPRLGGVKFFNKKFEEIDVSKMKKCVVYCDPPYQGTTGYKDGIDHNMFWDFVRRISLDNIVYVSEYSAPDDFECVYETKLITGMDIKSRKTDTEKLFTIK